MSMIERKKRVITFLSYFAVTNMSSRRETKSALSNAVSPTYWISEEEKQELEGGELAGMYFLSEPV